MAPKQANGVNSSAVKVAAWNPRADGDKSKKLARPQANQANQGHPGLPPNASPQQQALLRQQQNPGALQGFSSGNQFTPVGGVTHLSPTRGPDQDKQQALMTEVVAVAHHALGDLEGGNPDASGIARAGHLDSPESNNLWNRLKSNS